MKSKWIKHQKHFEGMKVQGNNSMKEKKNDKFNLEYMECTFADIYTYVIYIYIYIYIKWRSCFTHFIIQGKSVGV